MKHSVGFDVFGRAQDLKRMPRDQNRTRFPYEYALTSYISMPDIISYARICQWAQKVLWSIDGKLEIGLMSSVWCHCWYDDSVGTW